MIEEDRSKREREGGTLKMEINTERKDRKTKRRGDARGRGSQLRFYLPVLLSLFYLLLCCFSHLFTVRKQIQTIDTLQV